MYKNPNGCSDVMLVTWFNIKEGVGRGQAPAVRNVVPDGALSGHMGS